MKQQIIIAIIAVLFVVTAVPVLANNSWDEHFSNIVVEGNGGDTIYQSPRPKEDSSPMFLEVYDMTYYSVRVRALGTHCNPGTTLNSANTVNCTCSIYDSNIPWSYVLCLEDIDYSIHSSVWEDEYPNATYGFTNVYGSYTYLAGRWSPDSIYSHTDAYPY